MGRALNQDRQLAIALGLPTYIGKTHPACDTAERYIKGGCVHCKTVAPAAKKILRAGERAAESAQRTEQRAAQIKVRSAMREQHDAAKTERREQRAAEREQRTAKKALKPPKAPRVPRASRTERYFTGVPCKRGHVSERMPSGGCVMCSRETEKAKRKTRAWKDKRNAKLIAERAAVDLSRPCVVCASVFDPRVGNRGGCAKTCGSPYCTEVYYTFKKKEPDRECAVCERPFASRNALHFICSTACKEIDRLNHPNRTKPCANPECGRVFTDRTPYARQSFCSGGCRSKHMASVRAAYHKNFKLAQPEQHRQNRINYEMRHPEAHRNTTRNVNIKRIQRENEAFEVTKSMAPNMLKSIRGKKAQIKASIEFLRSIGVNHPAQTENLNVPL